jgi:hypothetical protein
MEKTVSLTFKVQEAKENPNDVKLELLDVLVSPKVDGEEDVDDIVPYWLEKLSDLCVKKKSYHLLSFGAVVMNGFMSLRNYGKIPKKL